MGGSALRRLAVGGLVTVAAVLATAAAAAAHPLGNFTVNHYARVEISAGLVRVYYVLDEAEIPTFQERDAVKADPEGFAGRRASDLAAGLQLSVDGAPVALRVDHLDLSQPPGQGGLPTLRLAVLYHATLADASPQHVHTATLSDGNSADRIGWREIVVTARGDAQLVSSDAPSHDLSDELRHYPANLIQAPLNLRKADFQFTAGSETVASLPIARVTAAPSRAGGSFTALIDRHDLTPLVLAGMLGLALLFGAAHALAPGHGKTVMAAYLVGTQGRPVDAFLLGAIVSAMHTFSVLVLGVALFEVSKSASVDRIYPVGTLVSGLVVVAVGGWLLSTRLRRYRQERAHEHAHAHGHEHGPHSHTHDMPVGVSPLSRRGLVVLAGSGGIVPSPSAVIVLISAFTLGRLGLGLALIAAFSIGLAATLTTVGLAMVFGRSALERRWSPVTLKAFPVVGAAALLVLGAILIGQGVRTLR